MDINFLDLAGQPLVNNTLGGAGRYDEVDLSTVAPKCWALLVDECEAVSEQIHVEKSKQNEVKSA